MVPTSNTLAHSHTRSLKTSSKYRRTCIIASGSPRMAHLFLVVESEPSVSCLSCFVYQMDKVEIKCQTNQRGSDHEHQRRLPAAVGHPRQSGRRAAQRTGASPPSA